MFIFLLPLSKLIQYDYKRGFIMKDSVFQMTSDTYQSLSDSERHLLEYIYQHLDVIATLSIVKLSEDANVSTATIVRLMKNSDMTATLLLSMH